MQAQTPNVGIEKATTPAEHRLVSVEQLKKIHRDLDACQKVIWLAGCRPRGYGFDPSYCTDAQERLKEIEVLLAQPAPAQDEREEAPHIPLSVGVDATKDGAHVCLMVKGYGDVTHVIHSHFYAARQDGSQVVASIAAPTAQAVQQPVADHTPMPITCDQIQEFMTGGGCPAAGSLGECAAMWRDGNVWTAALYIWEPDFQDSAAVAGWFRSLGASEIEITHTLYSTANGDRDGQCFEGVTRQWLVQFTMREAPRA